MNGYILCKAIFYKKITFILAGLPYISNKPLFVGNNEEVLIIPLHIVFFARIFFDSARIGAKLIQFFPRGSYLLLVISAALFELFEFVGVAEMRGNKVPVVKKNHPHGETYQRKQVFILERCR